MTHHFCSISFAIKLPTPDHHCCSPHGAHEPRRHFTPTQPHSAATHAHPRQPAHSPVLSGPAMPEKKPRGGGKRNQTVPPIYSRARGDTRERAHPCFLAPNVSFLFGCLPGGRGEGGAVWTPSLLLGPFFHGPIPWVACLGRRAWAIDHDSPARSLSTSRACMHAPWKGGQSKGMHVLNLWAHLLLRRAAAATRLPIMPSDAATRGFHHY